MDNPFDLKYSLMDRFIALYLEKGDNSIMQWIRNGLKFGSDFYNDRSDWFDNDATKVNWSLSDSENLKTEVYDAMCIVFSILGRGVTKINGRILNEDDKKYEGVSLIFNNLVRLSVNQDNKFTTFSKYKEGIRSVDVALQYVLYELGYTKFVSYVSERVDENGNKVKVRKKYLRLKGESDDEKNITFGDVDYFISRRIKKLPGCQPVSLILKRLRDERNKESHNAFYTNPDKYWNRLVYILYDYIAIVFFLMRYFKIVNITPGDAVEGEDLVAVGQALNTADALVKKCLDINVRFQFIKDKSVQHKLLIARLDGRSVINRDKETQNCISEGGVDYCYYDVVLEKNTTYRLQSVIVKEEIESKCGKELDLNSNLLFDGAVVTLKMPTEDIEYPSIKSVIAKSTGLIEDSENRALIEKILEDDIFDDALRSKLRVILMLDKGEKKAIVDEFLSKKDPVDSNNTEAFKKFVISKSDELLSILEKRFDEILVTMNANQDELKKFISVVISQIDLSSVLESDAEIKGKIDGLLEEIKSWQNNHLEFEKRNSEEAQVRYNNVIERIEHSDQTIGEIYEIFKSQNMQDEKILSKISDLDNKVSDINVNLDKVKSNQEEELIRKIEEERLRKIAEAEKRERERKRKRNEQLIYASAIFIGLLVLSFAIILTTSSGPIVNKWNSVSEFAHKYLNNKDIAYVRANMLEEEGNYSEAARWYMLARDRYADLLQNNPSDSVRAIRMTQMLMRGKGGVIDSKNAEIYANMAKRYDILAYLSAINGNAGKAITLINSSKYNKSGYYHLAKAISYLYYPYVKWDSLKVVESRVIIDSLAYSQNISRQEALHCHILLYNAGLRSSDDYRTLWSIAPSVIESIEAAKRADSLYNDLYAQRFLINKYAQLGLHSNAMIYYKKARDNGDKLDFSLDLTNDALNQNDPISLIFQADNNSKQAHNYYAETGLLLKKADSIVHVNYHDRVMTDAFYRKWLSCVVKAEDLTDVESILPILSNLLPDTIKTAAAEYIMAIKYWEGESVERDSTRSMEYLKKSVSKNLPDAVSSYLILRGKNNEQDLIDYVTTEPAICKTPVARYIISKYERVPNHIAYKFAEYMTDDADILSRIQRDVINNERLTPHELEAHSKNINWSLANTPNSRSTSYLLSNLAEIAFLLNKENQSQWFLSLALEIDPRQSYASLFNISEIARKAGNLSVAMEYATKFSEFYFLENGKVLDESRRNAVIQHFSDLYPEILQIVKERLNYDFLKGQFVFTDEDFDRNREFRSYKSPVKNLNVYLPDIDKFSFPVTMKYFE